MIIELNLNKEEKRLIVQHIPLYGEQQNITVREMAQKLIGTSFNISNWFVDSSDTIETEINGKQLIGFHLEYVPIDNELKDI